jgi:hypothetical protein
MTDQEEFERLRKRLYALADKMGQRLTIIVRRKSVSVPKPGVMAGVPAVAASSQRREPGDE